MSTSFELSSSIELSASGKSLEIFPIAIGQYDNHEPLDVETHVAQVVNLLADFGAYEVPWLAAGPDRGADAVNARLRAWARPSTPRNSILYWVGHGWSRGRKVSLAHARSPATVAGAGLSPEALAEALLDRQAGSDGEWTVVVIDTCWSSRFIDRVNAILADDEGLANGVLLIGSSGDGATT